MTLAHSSSPNTQVRRDDILYPLEDGEDKLRWEDYIASDQLKAELRAIAQNHADSFNPQLCNAYTKCYSQDRLRVVQSSSSSIPIILFHGPPGTGKTFGMKTIASETKFEPWILKLHAEETNASTVEFYLWRISLLRDAIVFIDEAETIFTTRKELSGYGSVMAQNKKAILTSFLRWADGLESKHDQKQNIILCLATNMLDNLDPAIYDRAKRWGIVKFEVPSFESRKTFWIQAAKQLGQQEHAKLAELTQDMSFRDMNGVAEQVIRIDARTGNVSSRKHEPSLHLYEEVIEKHLRDRKQARSVSEYLHAMPSLPQVSWSQYVCSDDLRNELQAISNSLNPETIAREEEIRSKCYGLEVPSKAKPHAIPVFLFHGPPGTGKTYAMQMIAATSVSALHPYVLNMRGLLENGEAETIFKAILEHIERMENSIIFIDECEQYFQSRAPLANYASVHVQLQKKVLAAFIEWSNGLDSRKLAGRRVALCMATNMPDQLDVAILDRIHQRTKFDEPGEEERAKWWSAHAKHLSERQQRRLAKLSKGFSYRALGSVSDKVISIASRRDGSTSGRDMKVLQKLPQFEDYVKLIRKQSSEIETSVVMKLKQLYDVLMNSLYVVNHVAWSKQNLASLRSRL